MQFRIIVLFFLCSQTMFSQDLLQQQLNYTRVAEANKQKYQLVKNLFNSKNLSFPNTQIFFRALKWNKKLELWAYSIDSNKYILVKTYDVCAIVGDLGPKRKEGDFQIPEGIYELRTLNPNSKYHLSIEISYPNQSDLILGNADNPGGDIYIHGSCETIGCLPMTDDVIKEIYIIVLYAKAYGQSYIPIHIFPTKLTQNNFNKLKSDYFKSNINLLSFWQNLKQIYDYFEVNRTLPNIYIHSETGKYLFYE